MTTFAYDYSNMYTRGWVRAEFAAFNMAPATRDEATTALEAAAKTWSAGTDLRLVQIDVNGTETFPDVTAKGNRGPLPKDKKDH